MRDVVILLIHLITTVAKLLRPGGARAVVAESLLVKHQLLILNRPRERAPNLRPIDRVIAGLCERLIGTIRHELLDQAPFWGARDLERKLMEFRDYYNRDRIHASFGGITPESKADVDPADRRTVSLNEYRWQSHCRGLYQFPVAA